MDQYDKETLDYARAACPGMVDRFEGYIRREQKLLAEIEELRSRLAAQEGAK